MPSGVKKVDKMYSYAFTAASMKFLDFKRLVNYIEENQLDPEKDNIDPNTVMLRTNTRTNKREFHELIKRYKLLTSEQRETFLHADVTGQRQIALIGICKAYPFIHDFITEVVREKFFSLDYTLTDGDYQSFLNRKKDLHTELHGFSDSTEKKARQVVWIILEQGGLINNTKERRILHQFVDSMIIRTVVLDDISLLKIFLMSDRDIKNSIG